MAAFGNADGSNIRPGTNLRLDAFFSEGRNMEPQTQDPEIQNITEIDRTAGLGMQKLLLGLIMLGFLYFIGVGIYGNFTRPNLVKNLAPFFHLPNGTRVKQLEIYDPHGSTGLIEDTTVISPAGMSNDEFAGQAASLNNLKWVKSSIPSEMVTKWSAQKGPLLYNLWPGESTGFFYLSIDRPAVPSKIGVPGGIPFSPGSVRPYPLRSGGIRSSIGSPGPVHPRSSHTGP